MRRGNRTTFHERLATDEIFHAIEVAPRITDFHRRELGKHSLHPSTKAGTTEDDLLTVTVDDFGTRYHEVRSHGTRRL